MNDAEFTRYTLERTIALLGPIFERYQQMQFNEQDWQEKAHDVATMFGKASGTLIGLYEIYESRKERAGKA